MEQAGQAVRRRRRCWSAGPGRPACCSPSSSGGGASSAWWSTTSTPRGRGEPGTYRRARARWTRRDGAPVIRWSRELPSRVGRLGGTRPLLRSPAPRL